jgi:hypothetical protein
MTKIPHCYLCDSPIEPTELGQAMLVPAKDGCEHRCFCSICTDLLQAVRKQIKISGSVAVERSPEGSLVIRELDQDV